MSTGFGPLRVRCFRMRTRVSALPSLPLDSQGNVVASVVNEAVPGGAWTLLSASTRCGSAATLILILEAHRQNAADGVKVVV